ncbi:MAG: [FeFe] hydrogenase, group A, partial [Alphaproteobacteria bacterium]|nr:[FeFe] hydrogenase, group A [Alphaproteobacteria bacterium]
GQCITHCPVGALSINTHENAVWDAIDNPNKHVVVQTAPAVRVAIGEEFGYAPGTVLTKEIVTALRKIGFDKVFDTTFGADMTIVEEGVEFLQRLEKKSKGEDVVFPQMTSCCPGWVSYIENFYPEFIPNLSTTKSPIQIQGAAIKTYYAEKNGINPEDIVSVSMTPCTAKKYEAQREEMNDSGYQDVDLTITTREVAKMMKKAGVMDITKEPKSEYDDIFGKETGSGVIFATTGGVMESALRTVIEIVTGEEGLEKLFTHADIKPVRGFDGIKTAKIKIENVVSKVPEFVKDAFDNFDFVKGVEVNVMVANGIANAKKILEGLKSGDEIFSNIDFIEVMACPGGCLGGGGQPVPVNDEIRKARMEGLYKLDAGAETRISYKNPAVVDIYNDFVEGSPSTGKSHKLFHTSYKARDEEVVVQDSESPDCDPSKCGSCKLKEPIKENDEYKI